eukprot:Opistho-2@60190
MDDEKRKIRVPGPIVDAHNHFWDLDRWEYSFPSPDMEVLFRNYLPEHFVEHAGRAGVDKGIYVQVDHNEEEIPWVLELSERHASIAGVVGWVDLTHPDVGSRLDLHRAHSKFVGVRHLTHNESDNKWLMREGGWRVDASGCEDRCSGFRINSHFGAESRDSIERQVFFNGQKRLHTYMPYMHTQNMHTQPIRCTPRPRGACIARSCF